MIALPDMARYLLNFFLDKITWPVIRIINSSVGMDILLENRKTSRVCRIPKADNPMNVKDYDLIPILPILPKAYEKIILLQMLKFIKKFSIYNSCQSVFW